ncbi:MAG: hypothetical protein SF162_12955 [bacterium]|nr:hypothetical protein [bacterium]
MTTTRQPPFGIFELAFDDHDLAANRAGNVTDRQRERLAAYSRMLRQNIGWALVITAALMVGGIGFEFVRTGGTLELFGRRQSPFVWMGVALFLAVMILTTLVTQINTRPLKRGTVTRIEGKAHLETIPVANRYGQYTVYMVRLDKTVLRFYQPSSQAHFQEGRRYRLYAVRLPLLPSVIPLSCERL